MTNRPDLRRRVRAARRQLRDERVSRGELAPRSQREAEIWHAGVAERFGTTADPSTTAAERRDTPHPPEDTAEAPPARRRRRQHAGTPLGNQAPDAPPDAAP